MNDIDASSKLTRNEFEELVSDVLSRVQAPIQQALADAGLDASQIDAVELVGGSSRVPAIKERISSLFPGKTLGVTLNQDEAVCRGATFACADISPVFKVRPFAVNDINQYPIKFTWDPAGNVTGDDESEAAIFPKQNSIPSTKVLTFSRKGDFDIEAQYAEPSAIPGKISSWLGKASIKGVVPTSTGEPAIVKVKSKLNIHGIVSFEGAYIYEEVEKEDTSAMDTDAPEGEEPAPKKTKKVVKKTELKLVAGYTALESKAVEDFREREGQMASTDKLVMETEVRRLP
jgi:heat shock protein 4